MNCDQARALLGSASDNELSNDSAAIVQGHLGECAKCQSEWEEILAVRAGLQHIVGSQMPSADFERRIMQGIQNDQNSLHAVRRKRSTMLLIGAAASVSLLVLAATNFAFKSGSNSFSSSNSSISSSSSSSSSSAALLASRPAAVSIEEMVAGVGHHSSSSSDHGFKLDYVGKENAQHLSSAAGFKVREFRLANYSVHGSDLVKPPGASNRLVVRMCYTSTDHSTEECIDCYQAPDGMMAFQKTSLQQVALASGKTVRVGKLDGQSAVMVSNNGSDVLYVSPIANDKLLALVASAS